MWRVSEFVKIEAYDKETQFIISRMIADLAGSTTVDVEHVAENENNNRLQREEREAIKSIDQILKHNRRVLKRSLAGRATRLGLFTKI